MKKNTLPITLGIFAMLIFSTPSYASFLTVDEWHHTGDAFGGLKQSRYSEDVFFAVSKSNVFQKNATYEMLDGYRLIASDEYQSIITQYINNNGALAHQYNYFHQGGWQGYSFDNTLRYFFTYADTATTGWVNHAGSNDSFARWNQRFEFTTAHAATHADYWAGFILLKDDSLRTTAQATSTESTTQNSTAQDVAAPTTLGAFALSALLLGFRRRNK